MTVELTAFDFADDAEYRAGGQSSDAEVAYPHYESLSKVPSRSGDGPYLTCLGRSLDESPKEYPSWHRRVP